MTAQSPTSERTSLATTHGDRPPRALRLLGLAAIGFGVAALAVATFVLSYSAIHILALEAGVAPRLARGYPLLIDAMLVIVLAAVLGLRGAGLPSRLLAWATLLAVLAAAAGADALHAAGRTLPEHAAEISAAVLPWALVFLAFTLLLAMLRHARIRRVTTATPVVDMDWADDVAYSGHDRPDTLATTDDVAIDGDGIDTDGPVPGMTVPVITGPAITGPANGELAAAEPVAAEPVAAEPVAAKPAMSVLAAVPDDSVLAETGEAADPDMPVFHRMWSSPTPPASSE